MPSSEPWIRPQFFTVPEANCTPSSSATPSLMTIVPVFSSVKFEPGLDHFLGARSWCRG
jgi:hypothetical protein